MRKFYWGGFCDGRLHHELIDDGFATGNPRLSPAIFLSKRHALEKYEDVRRIAITQSKVEK